MGVNNALMTFKVAYKNYLYPTYYDTLKVFVSTDCGSTYGPAVYTKGGPDLATDTSSSEYTPSGSGDWRTETISLNSFVGNNIVVKFETTNRWGNDLYLDDINITGTIARNSFLVREFTKRGWKWGGLWRRNKDYQHFEKLN